MTGVEVVRVDIEFQVPGGPQVMTWAARELISVDLVRWSSWVTDRGRAVRVTAFGKVISDVGSIGGQSYLSWSPERDEIPNWVPRPPEWFYTVLDADADADAVQQPERGRPVAECARCGRELYPGDYLYCPTHNPGNE
jgi:hypothetical protein